MTKSYTHTLFALIALIFTLSLLNVTPTLTTMAAVTPAQNPTETRKDNNLKAVQGMRLIHSVENTYQAGIGQGQYGSATDIFKQDFINVAFADSLGIAKTQTVSKVENTGTRTPFHGYLFTLNIVPGSGNKIPTFTATAIPAIKDGDLRTGDYSFFINEAGVIRFEKLPNIATANSVPLGSPDVPGVNE